MPTATATRAKPGVYWSGSPPAKCEFCLGAIKDAFIDGKAKGNGWWCIMDAHCHGKFGVGLGVGKGQRYARQSDGRFLRTGG